MSLIQFLRILAARRAIILATLLAALVTSIIISQLLPPRYTARSRVILDLVKPDPVSGSLLATGMLRQYISTQIELIKDIQTAGPVVDKLGWATDPALVAAYAEATDGQGDDIRRWLAQRIIDNTEAQMIQSSNILEIRYQGTSPEYAKQIADLVRDTFIETGLQSQRQTASRTADWYRDQADRAQRALTAAEATRNKYARDNGIVLDSTNVDLESSKLRALSGSTALPGMAALPAAPSPARAQLDQIDQQLAQAATTLGPNHPVFQSLQRQRAVVSAELARSSASGGGFIGQSAAQIEGAYQTQKSRVLAQRDKVDRLNQFQRDIDLKREQYQKFASSAAELRVQADVGETNLSPLGNAVAPASPSFPNIPLIVIGSTALGGALGVCLALLVELLGRRIRSFDDLEHATDALVFAEVGNTRNPDGWLSRLLRFIDRKSRTRKSLVEA